MFIPFFTSFQVVLLLLLLLLLLLILLLFKLVKDNFILFNLAMFY